MTSIETPGDGANIGGSPITGVSGPSGWVRSTTFSVPRSSAAMSSVSTVIRSILCGSDAAEDAEHLCEQPVHADAHDDERDPEADPVEHPHRYGRLTGAEQLRERRGAAQTPADSHHGEQRAEGLHARAERQVPRHEDGHVDAGRDREDEARGR